MFATLEASDVQVIVLLLAGLAGLVWSVWLITRQWRASFAEAVGEILDKHYREVTAPAMHKIDLKVDEIQSQFIPNDGHSMKDAVVRIETKADKAVIAAVTASGTSNSNAAKLVSQIDAVQESLAVAKAERTEIRGELVGVVERMDELHEQYILDTAEQDRKIAEALEMKEQP